MEVTTKVNVSIIFLILNIGVMILGDKNDKKLKPKDLYVLDEDNKLVKIDLSDRDAKSATLALNISDHVSFSLYTRQTNNTPEELYVDDIDSLRSSHFDPNKSTKFVTHGWMSSCLSPVCTTIRDAFLIHGDYNVITIDWSTISKLSYIPASNYIVGIAKYVSQMLDFLESQGLHASNVTSVGHSMGAHIAALASFYAKNKVLYVAGLDPAAPVFELRGTGGKLTKYDADYVEVIHTTRFIGEYNAIGDSDFYPNGGLTQNGCGLDFGETCSHLRAFKYFAESINSDRFVAWKCNNYFDFVIGLCRSNPIASMGGVTPNFNVTGKYYLYTNSKPPYAKGLGSGWW